VVVGGVRGAPPRFLSAEHAPRRCRRRALRNRGRSQAKPCRRTPAPSRWDEQVPSAAQPSCVPRQSMRGRTAVSCRSTVVAAAAARPAPSFRCHDSLRPTTESEAPDLNPADRSCGSANPMDCSFFQPFDDVLPTAVRGVGELCTLHRSGESPDSSHGDRVRNAAKPTMSCGSHRFDDVLPRAVRGVGELCTVHRSGESPGLPTNTNTNTNTNTKPGRRPTPPRPRPPATTAPAPSQPSPPAHAR